MLANGSLRAVTLRWQTSRWLVADFAFEPVEPAAEPAPSSAPAKKTAPAPANPKKAKK
jgi:hypothetical protein